MSNPVVFFDMEIGGQPAGRIEMTVRLALLFLFFSLSRTQKSDLPSFVASLLPLFCDVEEDKSRSAFSIAFFFSLY